MPTEGVGPEGDKRENLVQVLAETEHSEQTPRVETIGPPSPEMYARAEKALDELLASVEDENKLGTTIGEFCQKATIILGCAPITCGLVIGAIAESFQSPMMRRILGKEKVSFLQALRKEMDESPVSPKRAWRFAERRQFTEQLDEIKQKAKELEAVQDRTVPENPK